MGKTRVEVASMVENLEGKVWIMLGFDECNECFRGEVSGPGFDGGCDSVGLEELRFGFDGREVLV